MIRRIAFFSGLILGSSLCAWLLGSALIYLFTGKMPSVQVGGEKRFNLQLVDVSTLYEAPTIVSEPGPNSAGAPVRVPGQAR